MNTEHEHDECHWDSDVAANSSYILDGSWSLWFMVVVCRGALIDLFFSMLYAFF